jgi:hypothetical protein
MSFTKSLIGNHVYTSYNYLCFSKVKKYHSKEEEGGEEEEEEGGGGEKRAQFLIQLRF